LETQYPVITAHTANRESVLYSNPTIITSSTNRHVIQPTKINKKRRKGAIKDIQKSVAKGKGKHEDSENKNPSIQSKGSGSRSSSSKARSQLVDLVVEDEQAEEIERVRARKEGSSKWNEAQPKHFV
jgi:hypothetical protein